MREIVRISGLAALLLAVATAACREASPPPSHGPELARELRAMREAIVVFAKKQGRYPTSLEEMVQAGALPKVPRDPVTGSASTWTLVRETSVAVDEFTTAGPAPASDPIVDVRSGAPGADEKGVPWSDY